MPTIDTESIITQLMAVERRPQDLLKTRISSLQRQQNAWQAIADKLTALKTASDAVGGLDALSSLQNVTSSDSSAIAVRSIGAGAATTAAVEVNRLATAKSVLSSDTFSSATDADGGRTLDLVVAGGVTHSFTSADGTIGGLAAAVNAAGVGVSARVLQTSPGQYKLALSATKTGTAASFTAAGTGWGAFSVARAAADSELVVDGVTITRSSNVISDVIDGVELTLQAPTTQAVSINNSRDDSAIIAKVKGLVDAANSLGSVVNAATLSSPDEASRGPLAGDFGARRLMDSVRAAISAPLTTAGGDKVTSGDLGISLSKDGTINFDSAKLSASLTKNPSAVLAAVGRNAVSTAPGVSVVGATSASLPSSRSITVTQAASSAAIAGLPVPLPAPGTTVSMRVVTQSGSYTVSFATGSTWSQTASNMNNAMRAAGLKMTATPQVNLGLEEGLKLTDDKMGSSQSFTVSDAADIGLDGTSDPGLDAQGTIEGTPFTATGKSLTTGGMVLSIGVTADQLATLGGSSTGRITMTSGLAGALSGIGAQGGTKGTALSAKAGLASQITDIQKRVDRYDDTLRQRESVLRTKFSNMQTLLDRLNSTSTSITSFATSNG